MKNQLFAAGVAMAALMLPGFAGADGGDEALPAQTEECGAAALQDRIGEPVTGTTAEDVQVGGEPVESLGNVRVVAPGNVVTMEFNPERLTLETDEAGNLARAQCG